MILFNIIFLLVLIHIGRTWFLAIQHGIKSRHQVPAKENVPQTWPSVSIIVPAWRERGTVEKCIKTLQMLIYPTNWEVIIVAGGDDDTFEVTQTICRKDSRFKVIEQPPNGKNAALNLGISLSKEDILIFLDADSKVTPNWLKGMVAPLANGKLASTGNYYAERDTPISRCGEMEKTWVFEVKRARPLQGSGGIALQRLVIEQLGGKLPEDVPVGVDWDLDVRVKSLGIECVYTPEAILYTERPATFNEFWQNETRWRRAHLAGLWRHRHILLQHLSQIIEKTLFYIIAFPIALIFFISIASLVAGEFNLAAWCSLVLIWIIGRQIALVGGIAAYQKDWRWISYAPVMGVLFLTRIFATLYALFTMYKLSFHFKGARPKEQV